MFAKGLKFKDTYVSILRGCTTYHHERGNATSTRVADEDSYLAFVSEFMSESNPLLMSAQRSASFWCCD